MLSQKIRQKKKKELPWMSETKLKNKTNSGIVEVTKNRNEITDYKYRWGDGGSNRINIQSKRKSTDNILGS